MDDSNLLKALIGGVFGLLWFAVKLLEFLVFRLLPLSIELLGGFGGWLASIPSRIFSFFYQRAFAKQIRSEKERERLTFLINPGITLPQIITHITNIKDHINQ